jgi:chorismate synthase
MSGSTIGVLFRVTTWGESHGEAVGAVVDGCPPGILLSAGEIREELEKRRPGKFSSTSPRKETDSVEILSGIFEEKTTGTPISLLIRNRDAQGSDYDELRDLFRPGHGDFTYFKKYGIRDHRGGGRASGRETASRVAAGAIARKVIGLEGIRVTAYTKTLGGVRAEKTSLQEIANNELFCPDPLAAKEMRRKLAEAAENGDSLGGVVEILVRGCPVGLGEPVFDKMDADLAKAIMSLGTVKGVEIGAGFEAAEMTGSECNDSLTTSGFDTNHAGGILAGITTGDEIVIRAACKPIPSIRSEQKTVDIHGRAASIAIRGRHDVSVIPRIVPVCEAMVCIVIADHLLRQKANR